VTHLDVSQPAAGHPAPAARPTSASQPQPAGRGGWLARDLRTIRVLWQREVIRFGRSRVRVAMGLLTPLMFLLILGTGLGAAAPGLAGYRAYLFPGVLLMAAQAPALAVGASIVWDRQAGFLRQMLVAPVRRGALLAGICLGGATTGAFYGSLVLVFAGTAGIPYGPRLLLALLEVGLTSFAFTALGVLGAVCVKRFETFQVVLNLSMLPMLFLSGGVFPARGLPGWMTAAVLANPLTYAVDATRRTLTDGKLAGIEVGPQWAGHTPSLALELLIVAALALLALAVAARRFTRPA
jgi:ABC-2 type transport system permease protein